MKRVESKTGYLELREEISSTNISLALPTCAVNAARHRRCDVNERGNRQWREIASYLQTKYGQDLTADQVRAEMGVTNEQGEPRE